MVLNFSKIKKNMYIYPGGSWGSEKCSVLARSTQHLSGTSGLWAWFLDLDQWLVFVCVPGSHRDLWRGAPAPGLWDRGSCWSLFCFVFLYKLPYSEISFGEWSLQLTIWKYVYILCIAGYFVPSAEMGLCGPKGPMRKSLPSPSLFWKELSWWLSGKIVTSLEGRWWHQALMVGKYNIVLWRGGMILTCWNNGIYKGAFGRGAEIIVTFKFLAKRQEFPNSLCGHKKTNYSHLDVPNYGDSEGVALKPGPGMYFSLTNSLRFFHMLGLQEWPFHGLCFGVLWLCDPLEEGVCSL